MAHRYTPAEKHAMARMSPAQKRAFRAMIAGRGHTRPPHRRAAVHRAPVRRRRVRGSSAYRKAVKALERELTRIRGHRAAPRKRSHKAHRALTTTRHHSRKYRSPAQKAATHKLVAWNRAHRFAYQRPAMAAAPTYLALPERSSY